MGTITYDVPSEVITVDNFPEGSPCTWEDIYQADLAGAWGVVTKLCDDLYCIQSHLQIGSGNETWITNINKVCQLGTATTGRWINMGIGEVHLVFGELYGEEGVNGGAFIWYPIGPYTKNISKYLHLYGCLFLRPTGAWNGGIFYGIMDFRNVVFRCNYARFAFTTGNMNRVTFYCPSFEFYPNPSTTLKDIVAIRYPPVMVMTGSPTIRNYTMKESTNGLNRGYNPTGTCTLIDSYFTEVFGGVPYRLTIYRQWSFNLQVVDKDGNNLSGAKVEVWNKDGTKVVDKTTAADGTITESILTRTRWVDYPPPVTRTDYYPFRLKISKTGYEDIDFKWDLEDKFDEVIGLAPHGTHLISGELVGTVIEKQTITGTIIEKDVITGTISEK